MVGEKSPKNKVDVITDNVNTSVKQDTTTIVNNDVDDTDNKVDTVDARPEASNKVSDNKEDAKASDENQVGLQKLQERLNCVIQNHTKKRAGLLRERENLKRRLSKNKEESKMMRKAMNNFCEPSLPNSNNDSQRSNKHNNEEEERQGEFGVVEDVSIEYDEENTQNIKQQMNDVSEPLGQNLFNREGVNGTQEHKINVKDKKEETSEYHDEDYQDEDSYSRRSDETSREDFFNDGSKVKRKEEEPVNLGFKLVKNLVDKLKNGYEYKNSKAEENSPRKKRDKGKAAKSYFKNEEHLRMTRPELFVWKGDELGKKAKESLRLGLLNVRGIPAKGKVEKAHALARFMKEEKFDYLGMPESKLNPRATSVQKIDEVFYAHHPDGRIIHTNTYINQDTPSYYQHGGVTSMVTARLNRKFNGISYDKHGRWHATTYHTNNKKLKIYTVYRVNGKPGKGNSNSAWHDQEQTLLKDGIATRPERQVVDALIEEIKKDIKAGDQIIVMSDANEHLSDYNPRLYSALKGKGMLNVLEERFGHEIPPTQSLGREAIDHVYCTPGVMSHVKKVGIAPLYSVTYTDHRLVYFDLDTKSMFRDMDIELTAFERRRLKTSNAKRLKAYRMEVEKQFSEQKVQKRVDRLKEMIRMKVDRQLIIEMVESLDKQIYEIQIGAEHKLSAVHQYPWSPTYQNAVEYYHDCQNNVRMVHNLPDIFEEEGYEDLCKEACEELQFAKDNLKSVQFEAVDLREEFIKELAEVMVEDGRYEKYDHAYKSLIHIEKQKRDARKVKAALKQYHHSSLSHILIPDKSYYPENMQKFYKEPTVIWERLEIAQGKDIQSWEAITDRKELEEMLLAWQCLHFTQTHDTPLATKEWEHILERNETIEEVKERDKEEYNNLDEVTKKFLDELFDEKSGPGCKTKMTVEDFRTYIKDKNERTSTSPSSRHLGHLKAILNEPIFEAIFDVMNTALEYQHIPERWKTTVTTLIEKDLHSPKINRLRTIHIVEPEVQFITHFYWAKSFLRYCEVQTDHITSAQFGGRKGLMAHSAILKQLLLWDSCRMKNIPCFTHLADARANFDRNMPHIVKKAMKKRGFDTAVADWYMMFLQAQVFYLRSVFGVSKGSYTHSLQNRIYGDCQGLGWSAINQIIISTIIDNAYEKMCHKFLLQNMDKTTSITSGSNFYIDDRCTNTITTSDQSDNELIRLAQENETFQAQLLNASGGALAPIKCRVWALVRETGEVQLHYKTEKSFEGSITLKSTDATAEKLVKRLGASHSYRYLGAYINPDYNMDETIEVLTQKIQDWSTSVKCSNLTTENVHQSFERTLLPQLEYPLIAANLSYNECETLMAKIRMTLAAKEHYPSRMKLDITHGPVDLGGLEIQHLYDMIGELKLRILKHHLLTENVKADTVAELLRLSLDDHMLWLGEIGNFLNDDYEEKGFLLAQTTWFSTLWEYLTTRDIKVDIKDIRQYKLPRENDKFIMQLLREQGVSKRDRLIFNRIRMHFKLLTLSDVTLENGKTVHKGYLGRKHYVFRDSRFDWQRPEEGLPDKWFIKFYDIMKQIVAKYIDTNPLGARIGESHQIISTHKLREDEVRRNKTVFKRQSHGTYWREREATEEEMKVNNPVDVMGIGPHKFWDYQHAQPITTHKVKEIQGTILSQTPGWMKKLWGYNTVTEKTLQFLANKMKNPFIMVSDGGCPENVAYGTYSYVFANKNGDIFYANSGVAEQAFDQKASVRSEAYGQLAAISLINRVHEYAMQNDMELSTNRIYGCDNETVTKLKRTTNNYRYQSKKKHADVTMELQHEWCKYQGHASEISWVKGHQDKTKPYHKLNIMARLNIRCDQFCHYIHHMYQQKKITTSNIAVEFPFQRVSIRNKVRRFVKGRYKNLSNDKRADKLRDYMKEKGRATDKGLEKLATVELGRVLRKEARYKKIINMKVIHEQWITNREMHKMKRHDSGYCPLCRREVETQKHVYECKSAHATQVRGYHLLVLLKELSKIETPTSLVNMIMDRLKNPDSEVDYTKYKDTLPGSYHHHFHTLICDQQKLGWENLRKGLLVSSWKNIMDHHYHQHGLIRKHTGERWILKVIQLLLTWSQEIWRGRCKVMSAENNDFVISEQKRAFDKYVHLKRNKHLLGRYKNLLRHSPLYFWNSQLKTVQRWLRDVQRAEKVTARRELRLQPRITNHFQIKISTPPKCISPVAVNKILSKGFSLPKHFPLFVIQDPSEVADVSKRYLLPPHERPVIAPD